MDPKVFTQSRNLMFKAVELYYCKNYSQQAVAKKLGISGATVSRLLDRARENDIVQLTISPGVTEMVELEKKLNERLKLKEVIVAPSDSTSPLNSRLAVALEGARYLQNIIKDDSILGIGFGGTILQLIHYLNPCKKSQAQFVMLHGHLAIKNYQEDMEKAMERIANTFSGKGVLLNSNAYITNEGAYEYAKSLYNTKQVFELYEKISISVSSVGALYPMKDSALCNSGGIDCPEVREFLKKDIACGDIFMNFFDSEGNEADIGDERVHKMSIPFELYRRIPTKILVCAGLKKAEAVAAALRGGLADVLIVDKPLAYALLELL